MARSKTLSPEEAQEQTIKATCAFFFRTPMLSGKELLEPMRSQMGSARPDQAIESGHLVQVDLSDEDLPAREYRKAYCLTPKGMAVAVNNAVDTGSIKGDSPFQWTDELLQIYIAVLDSDRNYSAMCSLVRRELDRRHRDLFPDELGDAFDKIYRERKSQVDYRLGALIQFRERQMDKDSDIDRYITRAKRVVHTKEEADVFEDIVSALERQQQFIADQIRDMRKLASESMVMNAVQEQARDPQKPGRLASRLGV